MNTIYEIDRRLDKNPRIRQWPVDNSIQLSRAKYPNRAALVARSINAGTTKVVEMANF